MANKYKYFVGNWKMFGNFSSLKMINSVNYHINKIKKKEIKVIFCIPNILINHFSKKLKNTKILIGAQNCHYLQDAGPYTGSVNANMIKNVVSKCKNSLKKYWQCFKN